MSFFKSVNGKLQKSMSKKEIVQEREEIIKDIYASFKENSSSTIMYKHINDFNKEWLEKQGFRIYKTTDYKVEDENLIILKRTIIDWSGE